MPLNVMLVLSGMTMVWAADLVAASFFTSAAVTPSTLMVSVPTPDFVLNSDFVSAEPATTVSLPMMLPTEGLTLLDTPPANFSLFGVIKAEPGLAALRKSPLKLADEPRLTPPVDLSFSRAFSAT